MTGEVKVGGSFDKSCYFCYLWNDYAGSEDVNFCLSPFFKGNLQDLLNLIFSKNVFPFTINPTLSKMTESFVRSSQIENGFASHPIIEEVIVFLTPVNPQI